MVLLPLAAGKDERLAGDPTRLVGGVEHRDPGDIIRSADAAERRLGLHLSAEVALGDARGVKPLGFHHARVQGIHPDPLRAELFRECDRHGVHGRLGRAVDRRVLDRHGTDDRADVDDRAARRTHELDRLLSRQQQAEHVEVELLVEVLRGDGLQGANSYMPALFTSTSSLPYAALVCSKRRLMSSGRERSAWMATALPPLSLMRLTTASAAGLLAA